MVATFILLHIKPHQSAQFIFKNSLKVSFRYFVREVNIFLRFAFTVFTQTNFVADFSI